MFASAHTRAHEFRIRRNQIRVACQETQRRRFSMQVVYTSLQCRVFALGNKYHFGETRFASKQSLMIS